MPTYEYECKACGRSMDIFQRMTEDPLKKCPECGEEALERKIGSGAGIIFKGSGFYETDYKRKGASSASSSSVGGGGGSGAKKESSSKGDSGKKSSTGNKGGDS